MLSPSPTAVVEVVEGVVVVVEVVDNPLGTAEVEKVLGPAVDWEGVVVEGAIDDIADASFDPFFLPLLIFFAVSAVVSEIIS